ncbi:MAG TPA: biopolymer transporter ExbD [Opitutaceae bacterium]|jgi:biopolymer transport protein ExbD|nr:biopolymer transporter ExbD [Opitutaceae bacterium]
MAGSSTKPPEEAKKKARIEIIPLIDVIFFLLATFVLYTLSLDRTLSVPVTLPQTATNPGPPDPNMVTLQMSAGNTAYWKVGTGAAEPIFQAEIEDRLKAYKAQTSDPKVLVTADSSAKFGSTVFALDMVRKVGIDQVSIETITTPTGR